tara:strand:- start:1500 stop:2054 length:555 start_codon:yes stop_codon:yes gene_type:complete
MAKRDKQEVVNNRFAIDEIKKAKIGSVENSKSKNDFDELVPIKFKVHTSLIEDFHILRIDYAKANKRFSLSNNEMFGIAISFLIKNFTDQKILLTCPEDFKTAMIKPGKRKATERTFPSEQTDSILFKVSQSIGDQYMDLMYSYISQDPKDSPFETHHSRTYFFYDFINLLKQSKKELLLFELK